jgi:hypothetical protein
LATHRPPITATSENVDDVVARPPAVRVAGQVTARAGEQAAEQAEPVLRSLRRRGIAVFRRNISEATPVDGEVLKAFGWVTPGIPVRKVVTRSGPREVLRRDVRRGKGDLDQRRQCRVGHVGGELGIVLGLGAVELVLVGRPMITSLISGWPRRETWVQAPPAITEVA